MLDRAQRRGADAQAHRAFERLGDQRDLNEIGQEARARLTVGMADLVAGLNGLARQLAAARHRSWILQRTRVSRRAEQITAGPPPSGGVPPVDPALGLLERGSIGEAVLRVKL